MVQELRKHSRIALLAVGLAALWILAGALAKLFLGTPKDLPEVVRDLTPFPIAWTYVLVIGTELAIVCLAFLRPRVAWPVLIGLYAFFDFILVEQLRLGAESCGCFGATIKVDPRLMLAVDSALLLFLIATRPWKTLRRAGSSPFLIVPTFAVCFAIPWVTISMRTRIETVAPGESISVGSAVPPSLPAWIDLDPAKWVGQDLTLVEELTRWVPVAKLPLFGKLVLWRQGCDHCAGHLREMAGTDDGLQAILLVQIRDDLGDARAVETLPRGPHVTEVQLPENLQVVVTTPWEIRVEGGVVTAALDREATTPK